jgi:hypothetical protein
MPLKEDRDKILENVSKKVDGISKVIESLHDITKKQNELTSDQVAKQEEIESESKVLLNEDEKYRIKTTKLLEEIRDKEISVNASGGLGFDLGGILGSLGGIATALGALGALSGIAFGVNELVKFFTGNRTPGPPGSQGAAALAATPAAKATAKGVGEARAKVSEAMKPSMQEATKQGKIAATGEVEVSRGTSYRMATDASGQPVVEPYEAVTTQKVGMGERVKAGFKSTTSATEGLYKGFKARPRALRAGKVGGLRIAGGTAITGLVGTGAQMWENWDTGKPIMEGVGQSAIEFAKEGALWTAGEVGLSAALSGVGAQGAAAAVPFVGQMVAVGLLLRQLYDKAKGTRTRAEGEIFENLMKDIDSGASEAEKLLELARFQENSGELDLAKETASKAIEIAYRKGLPAAQFMNIMDTNEKLDAMVSIDPKFSVFGGQNYSIEDAATLVQAWNKATGNTEEEKKQSFLESGNVKSVMSRANLYESEALILAKNAGPALQDYLTLKWREPGYLEAKIKEQEQKIATKQEQERKHREDVNEAYGQYAGMMANEGIIEGSRFGSFIVAGENRTSEAVVSTKPNAVTESIGNNIYKIIKENALNDITATQRQTMVLGTVLANTVQEYNDAYKIAPLLSGSSSSSNPIIVNNMIGGMNSGRLLETNGHFNSAGTIPDKHESVLEKVYMDYYKAAML